MNHFIVRPCPWMAGDWIEWKQVSSAYSLLFGHENLRDRIFEGDKPLWTPRNWIFL